MNVIILRYSRNKQNKPTSTMPLPITMAAIILRKLSCCGCWGVSFLLADCTTSIFFGNGVTFCISYPFADIIYKKRIKHNHELIKVKLWLFSAEYKLAVNRWVAGSSPA